MTIRKYLLAVAMLTALAQPSHANSNLVDARIIDNIRSWAEVPVVALTLNERNRRGANLDSAAIEKLDKQWRAERENDDQPLITAVLSSPLSTYLTAIQARSRGLFTEIFVMDAKGLNAGQSSITSDYWQGDEAKWQKTYPMGATAVFVDAPEFNDSLDTENVQVNLSLAENGKVIGAITVEVNLTEMRRGQAAGKI
jgi:hypothetical protein